MRSWPGKFVLACGTISLLASAVAQPPVRRIPVIALLDGGDSAQWQAWTKDLGWSVIAPPAEANTAMDARIQALEKSIVAEIQSGSADPARIYLAGRGEATAAVFYTISRVPDLWAAAVALGGSPQPAIDSGRLYTANFSNVPVLWAGAGPNDRAAAESLEAAGLKLDFRDAQSLTVGTITHWLAQHERLAYPPVIDCETNSPSFARCYWIRLARFDAGERNDALASTRVQPAIIAALDLGAFGFQKDDPGPGVLVRGLPEKYSGPLKVGDRIVALDGREIRDAPHYLELMAQIREERPAVAAVQRGNERIRVETQIVIPKPVAAITARVQAKHLPEQNAVEIVSRTVTEMRVEIPAQWVPAMLNWNGVPMEQLEAPGCRLLTMEKEIEKAGSCPKP